MVITRTQHRWSRAARLARLAPLAIAAAIATVDPAAAAGRVPAPTTSKGYQARVPRPQQHTLPAPRYERPGPRVVREATPAQIARRRDRLPESHNWVYTANLTKTKAHSRAGHRGAANRQLARELKHRPELNARVDRLFGKGSAARVRAGRNPLGAQWDHQGRHFLHLMTKDAHAKVTKRQGRRGGGWAHHWKPRQQQSSR